MDRSSTRTSVVLHKFAKVPWLKLRRDDTVLDGRRRKKHWEWMTQWRFTSRTLRQVRVPEVPQIRSPSQMRRRSRSTQHLIWCCGVTSLVEYSNQLRKEARAFPSVRMPRRRPRTSSHTHVSEIGAATACEPEPQTIHITDNPTKNQSSRSSWPTALCRTHQARGCFTILDMLDVALGTMAAISVEEKGSATCLVSAVVEHLRARGRKKVVLGIDGEPAIRALGVAIQHARSKENVIKGRPKYSSPSMGPVENMNKELCGLVRCFRIYLWEKAKLEITTEFPLLPCLVRHCGWVLSRYAES